MNHSGVTMGDFAGVGKLYGPWWPARLRPHLDPWDSIELLLGGYVYERQGSPRMYAQVAVDVVRELREGERADGKATGLRAWEQFSSILQTHNVGLNPRNNPMAPSSIAVGLSMIELGREALEQYGCPAVAFIRSQLEAERVSSIHNWVTQVNGVADKIASFVLRDIVLVYDLHVRTDTYLLQPLDVWVKRCAAECFDVEGDIRASVVEASGAEGVNDALVNAGMWYFGAKIAGTAYRLERALRDQHLFRSLVEEHIETLERTAAEPVVSSVRELLRRPACRTVDGTRT